MRRLRWVPLAVLLLGAAEFLTVLGVAKLTSLGFAILGVLVLSLIGALLLRREGLRAWRRLRTAQRAGGPAGDEVLYGVVGLVAALLLLIPGYLTGAAGLLLLIPPVRKVVRNQARRWTENRVSANLAGEMFGPRQVRVQTTRKPPPGPGTADEVIEGEIVD